MFRFLSSSVQHVRLLASSLLVSGCSIYGDGKPPENPIAFTVVRDFVYTPENWPEAALADFYKPTSDEPTPAILLIHGGGWTGSDNRNQMEGIAKNLARRGYAVLNVTYRLAPKWKHPSQVEDMNQALQWLKNNAATQNIDLTRLAAFGYSAGAHLGSLIAFQNPKDFKAVVAGGTPSDLTLFDDGKLVRQLTGGSKNQLPGVYEDASPTSHVTKQSPPVFLYHATKDTLVPPEHAVALQKKLLENNVPVALYWIEGKGHITAFLFPDQALDKAYLFLGQQLR